MDEILNKETADARRMLLGLTEGVFSRIVDIILWITIFTAELSVPFKAYGKIGRAQFGADRFLEHINYDVIKDAIKHARRRGWLSRTHRRRVMPEITEAGKKRLANILPRYDELRIWDGRMHMVTYDIPEKRRGDRDMLREYLRRLGCGRLQASVWITPFNPIETIREFIEDKGLAGTVIVSDMGKDGAIGEEDVRALVVRVYGLERLNERYVDWLTDYSRKRHLDHWAVVRYLSILTDDPQLPFSILPSWWQGGQVFIRVKSYLDKVYI